MIKFHDKVHKPATIFSRQPTTAWMCFTQHVCHHKYIVKLFNGRKKGRKEGQVAYPMAALGDYFQMANLPALLWESPNHKTLKKTVKNLKKWLSTACQDVPVGRPSKYDSHHTNRGNFKLKRQSTDQRSVSLQDDSWKLPAHLAFWMYSECYVKWWKVLKLNLKKHSVKTYWSPPNNHTFFFGHRST